MRHTGVDQYSSDGPTLAGLNTQDLPSVGAWYSACLRDQRGRRRTIKRQETARSRPIRFVRIVREKQWDFASFVRKTRKDGVGEPSECELRTKMRRSLCAPRRVSCLIRARVILDSVPGNRRDSSYSRASRRTTTEFRDFTPLRSHSSCFIAQTPTLRRDDSVARLNESSRDFPIERISGNRAVLTGSGSGRRHRFNLCFHPFVALGFNDRVG